MPTASHRRCPLHGVLLMASKASREAALARGATGSIDVRANCGQEAEGRQESGPGPWTGAEGAGRGDGWPRAGPFQASAPSSVKPDTKPPHPSPGLS